MKIILNGLSLDKRVMQEVIQQIDDDREIKRLIKTAKTNFLVTLCVLVVCIMISVLLIISKFHEILSLNIFVVPLLITIPTVFWIAAQLFNLSRGIFKSVPDFIKYSLYLLSKKSPKKPLDLWSFFISNLSGSHTLIPASKILKGEDVKYIYCGQPYYEIKYVDSILLSVSPETKKIFDKCYKKYAIKTFENEFKKTYFGPGNRKVLQSRYVFGIFFFSKFLHKIIGNKSKENIKFYFRFSAKVDENKKEYARECIKLSSDPERTLFECDDSTHTINITIEDIFVLGDEIPKNLPKILIPFQRYVSKRIAKNEILIPFKRYIALPTKYIKEGETDKKVVDRNLILPEIPSLKNHKNVDIYSMGGAEHNLPLLHIINCHRYSLGKNRSFGIAENVFDDPHNYTAIKFHIGASQFVYGINLGVRHGMVKNIGENNSNQAEVFRLKIKEDDICYDLYSFYGYSAPMTRIAFLKFLYEIKNNSKTKSKPEENNYKL
ncbi:hypothetical protein DRJ25_04270 [Candidatus Woesearchaeota archaeon]|nr:MAG: hypothetical protein DRJ25_04270 [Candidatus Woesearchaeota archaeon]